MNNDNPSMENPPRVGRRNMAAQNARMVMPPHYGKTFWDGYFDQLARIVGFASHAGSAIGIFTKIFK